MINELKNSDGQQCRDVAYLIEYVIGIVSKCENVRLYKLVSKLGYKGFLNYYENIKGKKFREEAIKNIIFKYKSYTFKMIGKLPNYYILLNTTTNLRALLPIELSDNVNEAQIHAYVYKYDKKNNVLYANQIQIPSDYAEPCILKIGSEVIISFSLRNGNLYPQLRRLTSLIKVKVCNINMVEDYKLKYIAIVRKKITDFKYMVEIIDLL